MEKQICCVDIMRHVPATRPSILILFVTFPFLPLPFLFLFVISLSSVVSISDFPPNCMFTSPTSTCVVVLLEALFPSFSLFFSTLDFSLVLHVMLLLFILVHCTSSFYLSFLSLTCLRPVKSCSLYSISI